MDSNRQQLISPEGLRIDGRKPQELRRIRASFSQAGKAEGSAYLEVGNTKIHCSVFGPREASSNILASQVHHHSTSSNASPFIFNVDLNLATFGQSGTTSTSKRNPRFNPKYSRKNIELSNFVRSTFESVLLSPSSTSSSISRSLSSSSNSQIDVFIQVLQSDGSLMACLVNAIEMALVDAGIPLADSLSAACVAISAPGGASSGQGSAPLIVDPNAGEESLAVPTLTVAVKQRTGEIVSCFCRGRIHIERLPEVLRVALESASKIHKIIDALLMENVQKCWEKRNALSFLE